MVALVVAVAAALAYAFTNGLHDAANSIAALVATRAARPGPAVVLAAAGNILGPLLLGSAVAETVAGIAVVPAGEMIAVVGAALSAAVAWNLGTWWLGIPSSSGHALVGGLAGAALADAGVHAVHWGGFDGIRPVGVIGALVALAVAPLLGLAAGVLTVRVGRRALHRATQRVNRPIRVGEWLTSFTLAFAHGANDAQKAVGLVAVVLLAHGDVGSLAAPLWAKLACASAITVGTAFGGWPIVRTIGLRLFRIRPIDGLASQASATAVLVASSAVGAPVSTTQVVAASVVGAGVGRHRWRHVGWGVVREMGVAWLTTLPGCAVIAAIALVPWRWLA